MQKEVRRPAHWTAASLPWQQWTTAAAARQAGGAVCQEVILSCHKTAMTALNICAGTQNRCQAATVAMVVLGSDQRFLQLPLHC